MATTTIQTKHLGQIRGKTAEGVTQFLGVQYATLENRLADAQLVEKRSGSILDATKDGCENHIEMLHTPLLYLTLT